MSLVDSLQPWKKILGKYENNIGALIFPIEFRIVVGIGKQAKQEEGKTQYNKLEEKKISKTFLFSIRSVPCVFSLYFGSSVESSVKFQNTFDVSHDDLFQLHVCK